PRKSWPALPQKWSPVLLPTSSPVLLPRDRRQRRARQRRAPSPRRGRLPPAMCVHAQQTPLSAGDDEREDEAEERERFGERDAQEHRRTDGAGRLGLARHRRDGVTDDEADADAGADGSATVNNAAADGGETGFELTFGLLGEDLHEQ